MISDRTSHRPSSCAAALILLLLSNSSAWAAEQAATQAIEMLFVLIVVGSIAIPLGRSYIASARKAFRLASASVAWPAIRGKVLASDIGNETAGGDLGWLVSFFGSSSTSPTYYRPSVRYEYYVENVRYESDAIEFSELRTKSYNDAEARIKPYPPDATVTVRYDPNDPKIATLETNFRGSINQYWSRVLIIAVVFLVTGTLMLFSGIKRADAPVIVLSLLAIGSSLLFLRRAREHVQNAQKSA